MSGDKKRRVDEIQRYLAGGYLDDDTRVTAHKLHIYCLELANYYLDCDARRTELFVDAIVLRTDRSATRALMDEYGEFCAAGGGRHIKFVEWLKLREGT